MNRTYFTSAIVLIASLFLLACGGGGKGLVTSSAEPAKSSAKAFDLNIWDESFLDGPHQGDFELIIEETSTQVLAHVNVTNAVNLKALYLDVSYDPALYDPQDAVSTGRLAADTSLLRLSVLDQPGKAYVGEIIQNFPDRDGFSGSGELLTVRFNKGTFTEKTRSASDIPTGATAAPVPFFVDNDTIRWYHTNPGDYDENGEVNIGDLTPLGQNINKTATGDGFDPSTKEWVVDGDPNGSINISDMVPIGFNYGNDVSTYTLYASTSELDAENPDFTGTVEIGTYTVQNDGIVEQGKRVYFDVNLDVDEQFVPYARTASAFYDDDNDRFDGDYFFYVKASNTEEDGESGGPKGGNKSDLPQLVITNPPGTGSGTNTDPFMLYKNDDWWDTDLIFELRSATSVDLTSDPDTLWFVSDPAAGTISNGVFSGNSGFEDPFYIYATFDGELCEPAAFFFEVSEMPPYVLPDCIYAVPDTYTAECGDIVTIQVNCFNTANPFKNMDLVRVTFPEGITYVENSFNIGVPGGARNDIDGIWSEIGCTSVLIPEEFMFDEIDLGDGRIAIDAVIVPVGGSEITNATGALYNYQVQIGEDFTDEFEVVIGIQRMDTIDRTFYSEGDTTQHYWSIDDNRNVPPIIISDDRPILTLTNPPSTGTGSSINPYVIDPATDYTFTLVDPVDGDVTTDAMTEWTVTPNIGGAIVDGVLSPDTDFYGLFNVGATYNDGESAPRRIYLERQLPEFTPIPDSIYAMPSTFWAYENDLVDITVYCNQCANPFRYMNGVRVVFTSGNLFKEGTFNIGAIGGDKTDVDGVWDLMDPKPTSFLVPTDALIQEVDLGGGLSALDFNITPISGSDLTNATGAMFNFDMEMHAATSLDFQLFNAVNRTYYSDGSATNFFWDDITNDGIPPIQVTTIERATISLTNPPAEGTGEEGSAYNCDTGVAYQFRALHPTLGNVTTSPDTVWTVSNPAAGTMTGGAITITDGFTGQFTVSATHGGVMCLPNAIFMMVEGVLPFEPDADALYAVPNMNEVPDGGVVTITVMTGATTNPFQYLNGAAVTFESGNTYSANTFNVGAMGGAREVKDGIWTLINPTSFLLAPDGFIVVRDAAGGLKAIDFNVIPIGGTEVSAAGAIFNFGLEMHTDTALGFEEFNGVKRTYFSGADSVEYYWPDITNTHTSLDNTIDVT